MKKLSNWTYALSWIFIGASIVLVIEFTHSQRIQLVAGMFFTVGLVLNISGFLTSRISK